LNTLPAISFLAFLAAPAVQINSLPTARYIFPQKVQTTFFFTIADKIRKPGRKSRFFGPKTCFDHFFGRQLSQNCIVSSKTSKNVRKTSEKRPKTSEKRQKRPIFLVWKIGLMYVKKIKILFM